MGLFASKQARQRLTKLGASVGAGLLAAISRAGEVSDPGTVASGVWGHVQHNPISWLWLLLGFAFCYVVGHLVMRALVSGDEMPSNAGCSGCASFVVSFVLFMLAFTIAVVPLAKWIVWILLAVLFFTILIVLLTRGRARLGPLLMLFVVLILGVFAFNHFKPEATTDKSADKTNPKKADGAKSIEDKAAGKADGGASTSTANGQASAVVSSMDQVKEATVLILTVGDSGVGNGTGFFVQDNGRILTANHVLVPGRRVYVVTHNATLLPATVATTDALYDLAVLDVSYPNKYRFEFDDKETKEGTSIMGSGFSLLQSDDIKKLINKESVKIEPITNKGIVSQMKPNDFLTDARFNHGQSGGPAFGESNFKVVGVIDYHRDSENPTSRDTTGIEGCVLASRAKDLLQRAPKKGN